MYNAEKHLRLTPKLKFKKQKTGKILLQTGEGCEKDTSFGQRNQAGCHRDIRIHGNTPQPESQGATHEDGRKKD